MCFLAAGCTSSSEAEANTQSTTEGDDHEHEHHHEDDHEHEHGIPDHKPKTFAEAIDSLESRWAERDTWSDEAANEFLEIVSWLPEMAAQTDLKKPEWDEINAISRKLASQLEKQALSNDQFRRSIKRLRELQAKAEKLDPFHSHSATVEEPHNV